MTETSIVNYFKRLNEKEHFTKVAIERIGYPYWDKMMHVSNADMTRTGKEQAGDSVNLYMIPFVRDTGTVVNASLMFRGNADSQTKTCTDPYLGEAEKLEQEISTYLWVPGMDTGRVCFIEVYYKRKSKETKTLIHRIRTGDISTFSRIRNFFEERKNNWKRKCLRKTNIIVPLFLRSSYIDSDSTSGVVDFLSIVQTMRATFGSKKCFLYKPIAVSKYAFHIDAEPDYK